MSELIWKAFTIDELRALLDGFDRWFLDGGMALDHFLGRCTRVHGDIDIGVMSGDLEDLLTVMIDHGLEIYDATKNLERILYLEDGGRSHNYWISDGNHYKVQVLVYEPEGNQVVFRRNPAIRWPRKSFSIAKGELRIVNPLVIYAFKVTTKTVEQKDLVDIASLLGLME